ncbi:MAG: hypothetical protein GY943_33445 [Chloroflexi bacterium]|nr:hypothetical protein [Chloroflexota bacterium]
MEMQETNQKNEKLPQTREGITSKIKYDKRYMILLIIILGLGHVIDEYSSLAPGMVKSSIY